MKLLLVQVRSGIGDMILAGLPYIHALSKKFDIKLTLLAKESSKASDLFSEDEHIDEIITLDKEKDGVGGIFLLIDLDCSFQIFHYINISFCFFSYCFCT